jgi:hypothetical protein
MTPRGYPASPSRRHSAPFSFLACDIPPCSEPNPGPTARDRPVADVQAAARARSWRLHDPGKPARPLHRWRIPPCYGAALLRVRRAAIVG